MAKALAALVAVPLLLGAVAAPEEEQRVAFRFQDPAIAESSALVPLPGNRFATINDSGDSGRVFVVDGGSGETVGVTYYDDDPRDVEALARCRTGYAWVGDIGDNLAVRDTVRITEVPIGPGEREVAGESYELVYPDGPADAETLLCHPRTGRLYVGTKSFLGGTLYEVPARLDPSAPNRLRAVGRIGPMATDGAFFPDGRHLVVRGYATATVYTWPGLEAVGRVRMPRQEQGEGIGVGADGTVYVSSEGERSPVLTVPLRPALRERVTPPEPTPAPTPSAGPQDSGADANDAGSADRQSADATTGEPAEEPVWPWVLAGGVGLLLVGALLRGRR